MVFFKLLHILAAVLWVGGMFFAYMVLRPSAVEILQPAERLRLWNRVFSRFFKLVWLAVLTLPASGVFMISQYGGMMVVSRFIHIMLLIGIVMIAIFVYLFFACYRRFDRLVEAADWPKAAAVLATIRKLVAANLVLGLLVITVAILGRG
jgi:uncharacterized membrane protein